MLNLNLPLEFLLALTRLLINLENYKQALSIICATKKSSITNEIKPHLFQVSEIFVKIIVVKQDIFFTLIKREGA